jgi:cell division septum initiation protein DivIVA
MLNLHKVRRGQVFSFTLTELILLILFILLLLLWFITDKKNEELNKWSKVTGTETPEEYEMLYPNFPDKTTTPDVIDRLKAANKELALLKDENKELKEMIEKFAEKTGKENPQDLPLNTKSLIAKAEGMGRNPPCWPKGWPTNPDYEKADRIFNIVFLGTDKLAVIPDFKDIYKDQYKLLPIDTNILSSYEDYKNNTMKTISSKEFIESFNRLLIVSKKEMDNKHSNLTLRRDCRHEVRVFDELDDNKSEYKRLLHNTVEYIFTYYIFQDDNIDEYYRKNK